MNKMSAVGALLLLQLSGCGQMLEDMRNARAEKEERECNPGSQCWNQLSPDQKIQLARMRQEQAYRDEQLRMQRESLEIQKRRQRQDAMRGPLQTDCRSDGYGNTRCTTY